jgi:hypothetical protein
MDNLRGLDPFSADNMPEDAGYTAYETEDAAIEAPPAIGNDERRMQVRAYNFWTAQLHDKNYPSIEELDPEGVQDFSENSVLLDFTSGIENPSIQFVGAALRVECGLDEDVTYLDQVPPRSLLSRITDHYLQIIANRAPIGFEAEFVNDRNLTIMYRGILLPYSSDDDTIDFIYGVINWKEVAESDQHADLMAEVSHALETALPRHEQMPVWADSPTQDLMDTSVTFAEDEMLLGAEFEDSAEPDEDSSLSDWLSAARDSAQSANDADLRGRDALYQAIGRAYDFSLIAAKNADDYAEILSDAGLTTQARAPMTPIVKLVFGAGYDKTRITEFATALTYAHKNRVALGGLANVISRFDGGLKGIVKAERLEAKVRRGDHVAQKVVDPRTKLRVAKARTLEEFAHGTDEFVVLVARREEDGSVSVIGSVEGDAAFTEKALRQASV